MLTGYSSDIMPPMAPQFDVPIGIMPKASTPDKPGRPRHRFRISSSPPPSQADEDQDPTSFDATSEDDQTSSDSEIAPKAKRKRGNPSKDARHSVPQVPSPFQGCLERASDASFPLLGAMFEGMGTRRAFANVNLDRHQKSSIPRPMEFSSAKAIHRAVVAKRFMRNSSKHREFEGPEYIPQVIPMADLPKFFDTQVCTCLESITHLLTLRSRMIIL